MYIVQFYLIPEKSIKAFPRLPLEILFVWQWFSIKYYIFSEGGDFLRIIAIALFHFTFLFNQFSLSFSAYLLTCFKHTEFLSTLFIPRDQFLINGSYSLGSTRVGGSTALPEISILYSPGTIQNFGDWGMWRKPSKYMPRSGTMYNIGCPTSICRCWFWIKDKRLKIILFCFCQLV